MTRPVERSGTDKVLAEHLVRMRAQNQQARAVKRKAAYEEEVRKWGVALETKQRGK